MVETVGMPSQVVKAPRSTRKPIMVEGQDMGAPDLQASPEYTRIGGRLMRYDAQKQANAKAATGAADMMAKFALERVRSKGDIDEILARAGAAYHPPPQRRTQIVKDDATGEYVVVDLDQLGPTGLKVPKTGASAAQAKGQNEARAQRTALEDISSQYYALNEGGGIPEVGMGTAGAIAVINDPNAGAAAQTAARTALAKFASPETQKAANFVNQIAGVLMPLRGGKAITKNEVSIILGGMTAVAGESPEMRRQRMGAFLKIVGPVLAAEDGDLDGAIARIQQRAQQYAPQGRGQSSKPGTMSFDAALQRVKP